MAMVLRARVSVFVLTACLGLVLTLDDAYAKNTTAGSLSVSSFSERLKRDFGVLRNDLLNSDLGRLIQGSETRPPNRETRRSFVAAQTTSTVTVSLRPKARFDKVALNPVEQLHLGKLSGAIQSSPHAKEAHIASGQYARGTGPVSLAAALAVADYNYDKAKASFQADRASAQATLTLAQAVADAQIIVNGGVPTQRDIYTARSVLNDPASPDAQRQSAQSVVDQATNVAEARQFLENTRPPSQVEIDAATAQLEKDPPSAEDVHAAEDALLTQYEGGLALPDTPTDQRLSRTQQAVIDAVRASNPNAATVGALLAGR